jgi:hypothetical protein
MDVNHLQWSDGFVQFNYSLRILCPVALSISGVEVSIYDLVEFSFTPCCSVGFCFMYFNALFFSASMLKIIISYYRILPLLYNVFIPDNFPCFEVCFI